MAGKLIEQSLQNLLLGFSGLLLNTRSHHQNIESFKTGLALGQSVTSLSKEIKSEMTAMQNTIKCFNCNGNGNVNGNITQIIRFDCGHLICVQCLEAFIQNINNRTAIDKTFHCPSCAYSHSRQNLQRILPENWHGIINEITTVKCIKCEKSSSIKFNCDHFFCGDCLLDSCQEIMSKTIIPKAINCPVCEHPHSSLEMERICPEQWQTIINEVTTIRKTNLDHECDICGKQKPKSFFSEPPICSYNRHCKECVAAKFRTGNYKCETCNTLAKGDPTDDKGICTSCSETVYYVGDYLTTLCRDHTHCYNCLVEASSSKRCQTCALELKDEEMLKIENTLFGKCASCQQLNERVFLITKQCCPQPICALCQIKSGEMFNCLICKAKLSGYSIQLVQDIETALKIQQH